MKRDLEQRFLDFLETLPNSEPLDRLGVLPAAYSGDRADFALFGRKLIVEVKSLQDDPSARVNEIVREYQGRPGYPIFYGALPARKVLAGMPEQMRSEIQERVAFRITKAMARSFGKANRQIRETKLALGAPDAGGLLVILNDDVPIISPNFVVYRTERLVKKKKTDCSPFFPEIDWVMSILTSHVLRGDDGSWGHPIILKEGPPSKTVDLVGEFAQYIQLQWGIAEQARVSTSSGAREILEDYRLTE